MRVIEIKDSSLTLDGSGNYILSLHVKIDPEAEDYKAISSIDVSKIKSGPGTLAVDTPVRTFDRAAEMEIQKVVKQICASI